jgi:hypothetical protein
VGGETGSSAAVTWQAGGLDNYLVSATPTAPTSGQPSTVTVTARDIFNNTITTYVPANNIDLTIAGGTVGANISWGGTNVTDNGDGTGFIASGAGSFTGGVATLTIANTIAEGPVTVTTTESVGGETGDTGGTGTDITWGVGVLDNFLVSAVPGPLAAGSTSTVTVTARDSNNNAISNYNPVNDINLTISGGTVGSNIIWAGNPAVTDNTDGTGTYATGNAFDGAGQMTFTVADTVAEGPVTVIVTESAGLQTGNTGGTGTDITWQAGGIDNFLVAPSTTTPAASGVPNVTLTVTARDQYNNAIAGYTPVNDLDLTSPGATQGARVTWGGANVTDNGDGTGTYALGNAFDGAGQATITVGYEVAAEGVTPTVTESVGGETGSSAAVTWQAGGLDNYLVSASPLARTAGQSSTVTVTARDIFDNTITTYVPANNIDLTMSGTAGANISWGGTNVTDNGDGTGFIASGAGSFTGGVATVTIANTIAEGPVTVTATESVGGEFGVTAAGITWSAGALDYFTMIPATTTPTALDAPNVTLTITALDSYNNPIPGYTPANDLDLQSSGADDGTRITWGANPAVTDNGDGTATYASGNAFDGAGQATIDIGYEVSEDQVTPSVTESVGGESGTSAIITWQHDVLDHFAVTDGSGGNIVNQISSVPFNIDIIAQDQFDNTVLSYTGVGNEVDLSLNNLTPINPTDSGPFTNGVYDNLSVTITNADTAVTIRVVDDGGIYGVNESGESNAFDVATSGILDHFFFETQPNPNETAGAGITVRIEAQDVGNNLIATFNETATISDTTGTVEVGFVGSGNTDITFVNGVYNLALGATLFITQAQANVELTANYGSVVDNSNLFNVDAEPIIASFDVVPSTTTPSAAAAPNVNLTVTALDQYGNPIPGYTPVNNLDLTTPGATQGARVSWGGANVTDNGDGTATYALGNAFDGAGQTTITVGYEVAAEGVTPTVTESVGGETGSSVAVTWQPDALDNFNVTATAPQPSGYAGEISTITIAARDQFNNLITTYTPANNLNLTVGGAVTVGANILWSGADVTDNRDGTGFIDTSGNAFVTGVATITIVNSIAEGPVTVTVTESVGGETGNTGVTGTDITWIFGPLHHFTVTPSTTTPTATGVPNVTLTIEAQDINDNPIANYTPANDLDLTTPGATQGARVTWGGNAAVTDNGDGTGNYALGNAFDGAGQTTITVGYEVAAEAVVPTITESIGLETGSSATITWQPDALDEYSVSAAPTSLSAGQTATITITAEDVYDNVVTGYIPANNIDLVVSGTVTLGANIQWTGANVTDNGDSTGFIAAGAGSFTNGVALVNVLNTIAEGPVTVTGTESVGGETGNTTVSGTDITWNAGALDHFSLSPDTTTPTATNPSTITLTAEDFYNNPIANFNPTNDLDLTVSGFVTVGANISYAGANVTDNLDGTGTYASGNAFDAAGQTTFTVTDSIAEGPVTVTTTESVGGETGSSVGITWQPGALASYLVSASPVNPTAGAVSTITITAKDGPNGTGNTISTYSPANDLNLTVSGTVTVGANIQYGGTDVVDNGNGTGFINTAGNAFINGVATITVRNIFAEGPVTVAVTESLLGQTGDTSDSATDVTWQVGALDHFDVVPSTMSPTAGAISTLTITAEDFYGNPIPNYSPVNDLDLDSPGATQGARVTWAGNPAVTDNGDGTATYALGNAFDAAGQAFVTIAYEVAAEGVTPTVTESVGGENGMSAAVTWQPDALDNYLVSASPVAPIAGDLSTITITSRDQYNNTISTYTPANNINLTIIGGTAGANIGWGGSNVTDNGDGTGFIASGAGSFVNGISTVTITDTIAEGPVTVVVTESVGGETGDTTGTVTDITWNIGPLDHFGVVPDTATPTVGPPANVILTITAYDINNNVVTAYVPANDIDLSFTGTVTLGANITYAGANVTDNGDGTGFIAAGAGSFAAGVATVTVTNTVAEGPANATVTESVGSETGSSSNITWQVGALDHFVISSSTTTPTSGAGVTLTITAEDVYNNAISNYDPVNDLDLTSPGATQGARITWGGNAAVTDNGDGTGFYSAGPGNPFNSFGQTTLTIAYEVAGEAVTPTVTESVGGETGAVPAPVTWQVGALARFNVSAAPANPVAGNISTLTVTALDAFDNAIPNYNPANNLNLATPGATQGTRVVWAGANVTDNANGTGTYAAGNAFNGAGQTTMTVAYEVAFEVVNASVTESVGGQTGGSNNITWQPNVLQNFTGTVDNATPVANNLVNITIVARDQYGNYIPNQVLPVDLTMTANGAAIDPSLVWGGVNVTDNADLTGTLSSAQVADANGEWQVTLNYQIAGVPVTPTFTAGAVSGSGAVTTWQPDALNQFTVTASPTSREAGTGSTVTIEASDQFFNVITNYTPTNDIDLTIAGGTAGPNIIWGGVDVTDNGDGTATIATGAASFVGGYATVTIANTIAEGPVNVIVTESVGGETGDTAGTATNISWVAGLLARFILTPVTTTPNAGNAVNISITAADAFGNPKPGWTAPNDIDLNANGATQVGMNLIWGGVNVTDNADITGTLAAGTVFDGTGSHTVSLTYDLAWEAVAPEAVESVNGQSGVGAVITWQANAANNYVFVGTIPNPLQAGDTFFMRIEARDNLGNVDLSYAGGAVFDDGSGMDGILFRTDQNGATFPDATITFAAGLWQGNIRTDVSVVNNINRPGNQANLRLTETTAPAIGGSRTSVLFTVTANQLDHFEFIGVSDPIGGGTGQVRYFTQIPIEIVALDKYDNYVDIGGAFTGTNCAIGDSTGTIYEDAPYGTGPGDTLIDFVSTTIGGYAVAYYGNAPVPSPGIFVIQAVTSNNAVLVTDGDSLGVSGTSNTFDVVTDIVTVDLTNDLAPSIALEGETVDMMDFSVTNNDIIEDVVVTGLQFYLDSSSNGVDAEVDPSTLIGRITVETVSTTETNSIIPTPGVNLLDIPLTTSVTLTTGGGTESFLVTVEILNDVAGAAVPNMKVRIGDVIGDFVPSMQPIIPVDTNGNNITDPQYYIKSGLTKISDPGPSAAFNYPNPFNPYRTTTNIVFYSPSTGSYSIKIFTITGKIVRTLTGNATTEGSQEVEWDGKNGRGQTVRNGVYVAVIMPSGGSKQSVKIAVVK